MRLLLACLLLAAAVLPTQAQTINICDRTPQVRDAILEAIDIDDCAAVDSAALAGIGLLYLHDKRLTSLLAEDFDGLTGLYQLQLQDNQLTTLPDRVFDGLTRLSLLDLDNNRLTTLPAGVFDDLTNLHYLILKRNQLETLPLGVFDDLTLLWRLELDQNQLTALHAGVFNDLADLQEMSLGYNQLTSLPSGVFDGLNSLQELSLSLNQLTTLQAGVFDGLTRLRELSLGGNQLKTLQAGLFDDLTNLRELFLGSNQLKTLQAGVFEYSHRCSYCRYGLFRLTNLSLDRNQLTTLPDGVFDGLRTLRELNLQHNHLVGLTRNDPLFSGLPSGTVVLLGGQTGDPPPEPSTPPVRLGAAVPLMLSASDSMRQGFVRIVNESDDSGNVNIFAFDEGGYAPDPIEIQLGAGQVFHFNSNDLENGNPDKGIEGGVGTPVQGDWRLDIESDVAVRVLSFVRTTGGFLTAMHDVLPRHADGRLVAHTLNPGRNMNQVSLLRLVNTGANAENVSIEGVDDQGNNAGPVALTLPPGESRTLSTFDLENGAAGLTGTLGAGAGKWRLFMTAGDSVVGVSLLESVSGHLTNISTKGVSID